MKTPLLALLLFFALFFNGVAQNAPKREFRGAWIATYANIDWPNRTQTPAQQRAAFISIVDHHKATGKNALFVQVRSQSDALYPSTIEPWSSDLTGLQGRAPSPAWDPMQFMIEECHKRGIEFHAWINPYRAIANYNNINSFDPSHVARRHPEWLLAAGVQRILNPALPEVRDYVTSVIDDIVARYDVDGIHFDDYFYPNASFNDDANFLADPRGFTDRGDWRRDNVNLLVKQVSESIKAAKPWVKFGISPSGIYRNSTNPAIGSATSGLQHYVTLYADSRKWLQEGWIDYLAPQVYWYMGQPGANYSVLIPWWNNNASGRHIYIGMAGYKVNDPAQGANWANPSQIPNQVRLNREHANVYGQAIYNTSSLRSATKLGFRDSLRVDFYSKPALLPNMPWRDNTAPATPTQLIAERHANDSVVLKWTKPADNGNEMDKAKRFVVYRSLSPMIDLEKTENILAITNTDMEKFVDKKLASSAPYYYTVTALDRFHNESTPSNVTDYMAPIIASIGNQELILNASCSATLPDYSSLVTVSDDVSFPDEITLTQEPAAGTTLSGAGSMQITFTATDASGKSTSGSFMLTKKDVTAPVILVQNITRTLSNGTVNITAADINSGTWDNCGLNESSLSISQGTFDCSNTGDNLVTFTARDLSGNMASATAVVTIKGAVPQATISLSRADATYTGLPANTIALGYGAQSLTLTAANATSEATSYTWSPATGLSSTTGAIVEFTPVAAGDYTFSVLATNEFGCTATAELTVHVTDVRCGQNNDKVLVCVKGKNDNCVSPSAVPALLARTGATLGNCNPAAPVAAAKATDTAKLRAYPNPFTTRTTVEFSLSNKESNAVLEIYDLQGNVVQRLFEGSVEADKVYSFEVHANALKGSVYMARLITSQQVYTFKLLKNN
ncbi:family 10 glycosylhydrolase [Pontibacter ruber]|uniref:Family 10 glycosylhydrolase n=1 Tax=Pontibacter ruber TaxID=1343895 RepID=A0ABW5CYX3_9BACT|nr:family 10 glycosylhydrolase [Pontibacter ruber]